MPRRCSLCAHPGRSDIDAALSSGASLDAVLTQFGLPSRSALQRHRTGHLGREVTLHIPPMIPAASSAPASSTDTAATLDRLFARANTNTDRSIQDYARLVMDGLSHAYAAAVEADDQTLAIRALRELRAMLQFHAVVPIGALRQKPGWAEPPQPMDPIHDMLNVLLSGVARDQGREAEALQRLGWSADWLADESVPAHQN
ncbi:hypothetical protein OCOJLMKI_4529 [Methylobacterium iners]|uniref:Uncharacterized protein n=1 Tax=Methylobacterium iners TaxID=418707 RepID=A0ABQ4S3W4_9HYPH|nr:hypothetical protein OCOJLMKI_4529 [Methylobacterium iners]